MNPSASLIRAARAETERIERVLAELDQRRQALHAQLAALDDETAVLLERRELLGRLTGEGAETTVGETRPLRRLVKGRDLRRVAGRVLWQSEGSGEIQYRDWFERVLAGGYAVSGKDPAASFLTNVRDSPAVVRGSRPGFYRLDPARRAAVAQELAEAQAELRDVVDVLARATTEPARRDALRDHRGRLSARVRRLEADLAELEAIFGDDAETARAA